MPVPDGPVLIEGPVEIELDDGTRMVCDRFVVALCVCLRSRRYPLCDTSHRRRVRGGGIADQADAGKPGSGRSSEERPDRQRPSR